MAIRHQRPQYPLPPEVTSERKPALTDLPAADSGGVPAFRQRAAAVALAGGTGSAEDTSSLTGGTGSCSHPLRAGSGA